MASVLHELLLPSLSALGAMALALAFVLLAMLAGGTTLGMVIAVDVAVLAIVGGAVHRGLLDD